MKRTKKIILFLLLLTVALFFKPIFSNATTTTVSSESDLLEAIENASDGDVIELTTNIILTKPIAITGKTLTIDGNGNTISRIDTNWTPDGNNSTLITAGLTGTRVNLVNLTLKDSEKYGVQAYDGAYVSLDGVTISNCGYGGVLVNAGTVEVKNLILYKNGQYSNNGIEIAKGNGVYTEGTNPKLIMNGTISSTEKENVIYLAVNDKLAEFELENTENTVNKILASGNKVVVTDENNNVLYESNVSDTVTIEGENYVQNVTITINLMEQSITMTVKDGTIITKENVEAKINLETLGLGNYTLVDFYSDAEYMAPFDFTKPVTANTSIYAKLNLIENNNDNNNTDDDNNTTTNNDNNTQNNQTVGPKDETPKTGVENHLGISASVVIISIIGLALLRRKKL